MASRVRYLSALGAGVTGAAARALGGSPPVGLEPASKDRRFSDPAWEHQPWFFAERQSYLAWARGMQELAAFATSPAPSRPTSSASASAGP